MGGLDCLGLVLWAAEHGGVSVRIGSQLLRGHTLSSAHDMFRAAGCLELPLADNRPGDILLGCPATWQVHLAIRTDQGIVEACARLRRVVERPGLDVQRWRSAWRLPEGES
ncbi:MAG: hypothetical protein DI568_11770 [Sphingomonas sp.]|nr:MAG: hypothetical protein DI568_11770 [Sphingomonas sp.]